MGTAWWQTDWVWVGTGWVLCAVGVLVLGWALFWDRARGRRRCPKCWYDMSGAVARVEEGRESWVCPECGGKIKKERKLRKTRRRWRWAIISVALLLGGAAALVYRVCHADPWSHVSTRWLLELLPVGGYDGPFGKELMRRLGQIGPRSWGPGATASAAEFEAVAKALPKGTFFARPMSDRWQESYGRVIEETGSTVFGLAGWHVPTAWTAEEQRRIQDAARTWYDLPPLVSIRTRPRWPEGIPIWVEIDSTTYWPWPAPLHVGIRRTGTTGEFRSIWPPIGFLAKPPSSPDQQTSFELHLEQYRQGDRKGDDWNSIPNVDLGTRVFNVDCRVGGTIDQFMTPVESSLIDDRLKDALKYSAGQGWVSFDTNGSMMTETAGIAFGVIVEFRLDGELIAKERHWWLSGGSPPKGSRGGSEWIAVDPKPTRRAHPWSAQPGEKWTLVMRSDPETALRVIDADHYWQGNVPVVFEISSPPPRPYQDSDK